MAIENTVSNVFLIRIRRLLKSVFDCHLSGVNKAVILGN